MKALSLIMLAATLTSFSAQADICGLATQAEAQMVIKLVKAQAQQAANGKAILRDTWNKKNYTVDSITVGKTVYNLGNAKYVDLFLKSGKEVLPLDLGYTYLFMANTDTAVNLAKLTNCSGNMAQHAGDAVIQVK
jgi:hypothetical protein